MILKTRKRCDFFSAPQEFQRFSSGFLRFLQQILRFCTLRFEDSTIFPRLRCFGTLSFGYGLSEPPSLVHFERSTPPPPKSRARRHSVMPKACSGRFQSKTVFLSPRSNLHRKEPRLKVFAVAVHPQAISPLSLRDIVCRAWDARRGNRAALSCKDNRAPQSCNHKSLLWIGSFGKGVFWKRGLLRKVHFLEILENLEIPEFPEKSQTVEKNKGNSSQVVADVWENSCHLSGSFFHPQPPSLLILLPEPGSERKVLTKETWFSLVREWKSWKLQWEPFSPQPGSP